MPSIVGKSRSSPRFSTSAAMNRATLAEQFTVVSRPIMLRVPTFPFRRRKPSNVRSAMGRCGARRNGRQLAGVRDRSIAEVVEVDVVARGDGFGRVPDDLAVLVDRSTGGDRP